MTRERWGELIDRLRERFPDVQQTRHDLDPGPGTVDRVIVRTPAGCLRLELTERPRLLAERGMGSRRIGSAVVVERRYDPSETVLLFKVYRQGPDGSWTALDPGAIP